MAAAHVNDYKGMTRMRRSLSLDYRLLRMECHSGVEYRGPCHVYQCPMLMCEQTRQEFHVFYMRDQCIRGPTFRLVSDTVHGLADDRSTQQSFASTFPARLDDARVPCSTLSRFWPLF